MLEEVDSVALMVGNLSVEEVVLVPLGEAEVVGNLW